MNTDAFIRSRLSPSAGLIVAPLLWAANTQAGQILPYAECGSFKITAATSFLAAALSLVMAYLSWLTVRRDPSEGSSEVTLFPANSPFIGLLSSLIGVLFAFALLLQGLSSVVLTGCER
jgi:Mn2+/Fe2+ NRAMP family transporter